MPEGQKNYTKAELEDLQVKKLEDLASATNNLANAAEKKTSKSELTEQKSWGQDLLALRELLKQEGTDIRKLLNYSGDDPKQARQKFEKLYKQLSKKRGAEDESRFQALGILHDLLKSGDKNFKVQNEIITELLTVEASTDKPNEVVSPLVPDEPVAVAEAPELPPAEDLAKTQEVVKGSLTNRDIYRLFKILWTDEKVKKEGDVIASLSAEDRMAYISGNIERAHKYWNQRIQRELEKAGGKGVYGKDQAKFELVKKIKSALENGNQETVETEIKNLLDEELGWKEREEVELGKIRLSNVKEEQGNFKGIKKATKELQQEGRKFGEDILGEVEAPAVAATNLEKPNEDVEEKNPVAVPEQTAAEIEKLVEVNLETTARQEAKKYFNEKDGRPTFEGKKGEEALIGTVKKLYENIAEIRARAESLKGRRKNTLIPEEVRVLKDVKLYNYIEKAWEKLGEKQKNYGDKFNFAAFLAKERFKNIKGFVNTELEGGTKAEQIAFKDLEAKDKKFKEFYVSASPEELSKKAELENDTEPEAENLDEQLKSLKEELGAKLKESEAEDVKLKMEDSQEPAEVKELDEDIKGSEKKEKPEGVWQSFKKEWSYFWGKTVKEAGTDAYDAVANPKATVKKVGEKITAAKEETKEAGNEIDKVIPFSKAWSWVKGIFGGKKPEAEDSEEKEEEVAGKEDKLKKEQVEARRIMKELEGVSRKDSITKEAVPAKVEKVKIEELKEQTKSSQDKIADTESFADLYEVLKNIQSEKERNEIIDGKDVNEVIDLIETWRGMEKNDSKAGKNKSTSVDELSGLIYGQFTNKKLKDKILKLLIKDWEGEKK